MHPGTADRQSRSHYEKSARSRLTLRSFSPQDKGKGWEILQSWPDIRSIEEGDPAMECRSPLRGAWPFGVGHPRVLEQTFVGCAGGAYEALSVS